MTKPPIWSVGPVISPEFVNKDSVVDFNQQMKGSLTNPVLGPIELKISEILSNSDDNDVGDIERWNNTLLR